MTDLQIQEALRSANWDRAYALLKQTGRDEEARQILFCGPIQIECTLQYRFELSYQLWSYSSADGQLYGSTVDQLMTAFLSKNISPYTIMGIEEEPIVQIEGKAVRWSSEKYPSRNFTEKKVEDFRQQVLKHSDYLKTASDHERAEANHVTRRHRERVAERIAREEQQRVRERRRKAALIRASEYAQEGTARAYELFQTTQGLTRRELAERMVNEPYSYLIFKLRDCQERNQPTTPAAYNELLINYAHRVLATAKRETNQ